MAAEIGENMKMDAKEQTKMIRSHVTTRLYNLAGKTPKLQLRGCQPAYSET